MPSKEVRLQPNHLLEYLTQVKVKMLDGQSDHDRLPRDSRMRLCIINLPRTLSFRTRLGVRSPVSRFHATEPASRTHQA